MSPFESLFYLAKNNLCKTVVVENCCYRHTIKIAQVIFVYYLILTPYHLIDDTNI